MSPSTLGSTLTAAAKLLRGNDTVAGAARDWEAEATRMRVERDEANAQLAALQAKFEHFDNAMGEIFSLCLDHLPDDIELQIVKPEDSGTAEDCAAAARNVLRHVRAVLARQRGTQDGAAADSGPGAAAFDGAKMERLLDEARTDALQEAILAVNRTAAPVVGTPYSVGGRLFAEAIRERLKQQRPAKVGSRGTSAPSRNRSDAGKHAGN